MVFCTIVKSLFHPFTTRSSPKTWLSSPSQCIILRHFLYPLFVAKQSWEKPNAALLMWGDLQKHAFWWCIKWVDTGILPDTVRRDHPIINSIWLFEQMKHMRNCPHNLISGNHLWSTHEVHHNQIHKHSLTLAKHQ